MSTPEPPAPPEQPPGASAETPSTPPPATPAPRPPAAPVEEEDQPSTFQPWLYIKIGLLLIVIAYAIAFVVKNTRQIKIDFVFTDANVRVIWTILLLLAIGHGQRDADLAAIPPPATSEAREAGPQAGRLPLRSRPARRS